MPAHSTQKQLRKARAAGWLLAGALPIPGICDIIAGYGNMPEGTCAHIIMDASAIMSVLAGLPGGRIAVSTWNMELKIFGSDFTYQCTLEGHSGLTRALVLAPDPTREYICLVSGSSDTTVRVWDPVTGACVRVLSDHKGYVNSVVVLPKTDPTSVWLASGSKDTTIRIWNIRGDDSECVRVLVGHTDWVLALAVLNGDNLPVRLASSSRDTTARVWNSDTGECLHVLRGHTDTIPNLVALPDGKLATASWDETIRRWDTDTGICLNVLRDHKDWANILTDVPGISPEDPYLFASGSADHTVRLWNFATGTCTVMSGHTGSVLTLLVTKDRLILSGSADGTIRVWDPTSGACLRILSGHTGYVSALAELPDGRLVSCSGDKTFRVWE